MSRSKTLRRTSSAHAEGLSYWNSTRRPLQILAFLLPLILAYELGLMLVLRTSDGSLSEAGEGVLTNVAHAALLRFFAMFGISWLYLGGAVIVVVLLIWHLLNRDPWRVDWKAVGLMAAESLLLALPLIAIGELVNEHISITAAATNGAVGAGGQLADLNLPSKLAVSIGAGLYEELMFRWLLIAVLHTLLVDLAKASHVWGSGIAVVVAAAAFSLYHRLGETSGNVPPANLVFYFLAGLYFGAVYVLRGFGIVVAAHAAYDVIVLTLLNDSAAG